MSYGNISLALRKSAVRASGGIGRLAGFRCQCSQGRAGSTPASRTSSSQAAYRLRRVFYASHQKLIAHSFRCSSLPNRIRLRWIPIRGRRSAAFLFYFEKISILTALCKKERHDHRSCLSFLVPAAGGGLQSSVFGCSG